MTKYGISKPKSNWEKSDDIRGDVKYRHGKRQDTVKDYRHGKVPRGTGSIGSGGTQTKGSGGQTKR